MIHVLKCCVNEQVSVLAMIMDWCCALHFYLLLCTLTSQRSENKHPLCLGVQSHECLRSAQFSSAVKRLNSTFCDTVSPLREGLFLLSIQVPLKSSLKSVWTCQFTIKLLMNSNMGVTHLHNLEKLLVFCPLMWSPSFKLISVKTLSQLSLELRGVLVG